MPTNRARRRRDRQFTHLSPAAAWWLERGGYMPPEAAAGMDHPRWAVMEVYALESCSEGAITSPFLTRSRLRAAGYGEALDALIAAGKTVPDDYFTRRPADG